MTDIQITPKFSAEMWAAFWAGPELSQGKEILADDIVGYWPGQHEPVRGLAAYTSKIADLLRCGDLEIEPGARRRHGRRLAPLAHVPAAQGTRS